eukprot:10724378-Lingulodinium_polyedra.AAC.1
MARPSRLGACIRSGPRVRLVQKGGEHGGVALQARGTPILVSDAAMLIRPQTRHPGAGALPRRAENFRHG